MTIRDIEEILDAVFLAGHDQADRKVEIAGSADMVSEFLKFARPGTLILTGLANIQIVQCSHVLDASGIVVVRGKTPSQEMLARAEGLRIPVLATRYTLFETSGRLYANGIVGCVNKL
ncbi:MAG: transcriptional regulator [Deltaproteobacteria bacterium]|nr:transcriptional regulator [Deltaproteobacteria bacterium]